MGRRIDFYDDPEAPRATSIVPSANVIVVNDDGEIIGLVGIYTDPCHVILYTSNNEARQEFSLVFTARPVGGRPTTSAESTEVRWCGADEIGSLTMDRSMRMRVDNYLMSPQDVHIG